MTASAVGHRHGTAVDGTAVDGTAVDGTAVDGTAVDGLVERSRRLAVAVVAGPTLGPAISALLADVYGMRVVGGDAGAAVALVLAPHPTPRGVPVVLLTGERPDGPRLVELVRAGCVGVLADDAPVAEIVETLVAAAGGSVGFDGAAVRALCDAVRAESPTGVGAPRLTPRERQLLGAAFSGMSIKQTARVLGISPRTVENLQRPLFRKLGAKNRAEAVVRAHELGLQHLDPGNPPEA